MSEAEPESRDSSATTAQNAGESPTRKAGAGIPPISPRAHHKERNSSMKGLLGTHGSPRFLHGGKPRSMSLGQYPVSASLFVPPASQYSPVMPPSSPVPPMAASTALFMPNLSLASPTRTAMEAAVQSERARAKLKEKEEEEMTADELRVVLKRERTRMSKFAADLTALRAAAVQSQAEAEVHEEGRINCLMRRLEGLQQEKGRLIVELEQEEEMLTNTLQKKLNEVRREKALLEQQIEREQKSHADLQSSLGLFRDEKADSISESGEEPASSIADATSAKPPDQIPPRSLHEHPEPIPETEEESDDMVQEAE